MKVVFCLPRLRSPANMPKPDSAGTPKPNRPGEEINSSETDWTCGRQSYHDLHGIIIHDSLLRIWAWLWCSRLFGLKFWGFGVLARLYHSCLSTGPSHHL